MANLCRVCLAALPLASPAWAVLGGSAVSVQTDQIYMHGTLRTTQAAAYKMHEIKTASGIYVREFVSSGTVFAVAWQGPWPPDMRQLLGSYFEEYTRAAAQQQVNQRPGRQPLVIQEPGLVVEMGGHPRAFVGRAYVPAMLPANVRAEDIR